jgi:hypothetical protein
VRLPALEGEAVFTLDVVRYDGRRDMPGGDAPPLAESHRGALGST